LQKAVIISAPSGAGKTSIVKYLLEKERRLAFSVSATSRARRSNETEGRDYYFMAPDDFRKKISSGDFIEWEQVYEGVYYGTLKSEVDRLWNENKTVIFDVDVKGGLNLKKFFGNNSLSIFIRVADIRTLEERLRSRKSESEESLRVRLAKAASEMKFEKDFDVVILNDDLEKACRQAYEKVSEFLKE
jgi:guanylate kinase